MKDVKLNFTINDISKLCGVNKPTIRIWEKRYKILNPRITDNQRIYDFQDLQKILYIAVLNGNGYKISRIAKLSNEEVIQMVKEIRGSEGSKNRAKNMFKIAMINFDQSLFDKTYNNLERTRTLSQIFHEIFMPLIGEIGVLLQTDTINTVHEKFLLSLLKEKLYLNIAFLKREKGYSTKDLYVLFLPEFEVFNLELLFLNNELLLRKNKTILLSQGLPLSNLKYLLQIHPNPIFISYLTIFPKDLPHFFKEFETQLSKGLQIKLLLFGPRVQSLDTTSRPPNIRIFKSLFEFVNELDLQEI